MKENLDTYCSRLRQHVAMAEKNANAAQLSYRAIDAFENSMRQLEISAADLAIIVAAAKSTRRGTFSIGIELMASLLEKFMIIKDAWRQLARSSIAHERWVAITALYGDKIPRSFAEELVFVALDDKSSKVRFFAVERVYTQKLKALLPKLKERISLEKDAKVAKHIQWVLNMLERGYHIHAPNAKGVGGSIDLQVDDSEIAAATLPLQKVQGHNKKAREID